MRKKSRRKERNEFGGVGRMEVILGEKRLRVGGWVKGMRRRDDNLVLLKQIIQLP